MALSSLLAALLPGDSFLLRRNASRFFMSFALRKIKRKRENRVGGGGEEGKSQRCMSGVEWGKGWEDWKRENGIGVDGSDQVDRERKTEEEKEKQKC